MTFQKELEQLINRHSRENESNTPDFVLTQYIEGCLSAFTTAVQQRETYYGRDARPSMPRPQQPYGEARMSTSDRLTPKEIKAWCQATILKTYGWEGTVLLMTDEGMVDLMYKAYKRGYQDALSG